MRNVIDVIRNTVRALVIREGKILVLEKDGRNQGTRYTLPGGAQDPGESLEDALIRECFEEIGTRVGVRGLLHVAEHFKPVASDPAAMRHRIEFVFDCEVPPDYVPRNGQQPDSSQIGVTWLDLAEIEELPFDPAPLGEHIKQISDRLAPVYLGMIG